MAKIKFPWFKKKIAKLKTGQRMFAGAMYGRLVTDWIAQGSSMDAEIRSSLTLLRNRSRQLGRDNDYVKGFYQEVRNNIVGEGIRFQAQVKQQRGNKLNKKANSQIELQWKAWAVADACHVAGSLAFPDIERLVIGETAQSGEIFIRMIKGRKFGKSKIPFALEIIEADQLDEAKTGRHDNGNEIRMGVEVDQWKRPVAYWFKTIHPGDYPFVNTQSANRWDRVPAEQIIPMQMFTRALQTRSEPWIASSIMRLHQMGGYEEAEVIAARATASIMGFITSPDGQPSADGVQDAQRVQDFQPGVFKYLAPGEKVEVPDTHRPGGQFEPFMRMMLRGVAAGLSVSYSTVSRDYSQSNFSSSRMDLLNERRNWRVIQKWMQRKFHQIIFENWLEMAVLSGAVDLPGYELAPENFNDVKWMAPGWSWIDPVKEVTAAKEAILGGLSTMTNELAQNGEDIEDVMDQRQREIELAKEKGLIFDTDFANDMKKAPKSGPQAADGGDGADGQPAKAG